MRTINKKEGDLSVKASLHFLGKRGSFSEALNLSAKWESSSDYKSLLPNKYWVHIKRGSFSETISLKKKKKTSESILFLKIMSLSESILKMGVIR